MLSFVCKLAFVKGNSNSAPLLTLKSFQINLLVLSTTLYLHSLGRSELNI